MRVLCSLLILSAIACGKKENGPVEAQRLSADTINLKEILDSKDPVAVKSGLENWLALYPKDINRVFPSDATTPLGMIGQKYFAASDKQPWLELITLLLDAGADPNIFLNYQGTRRGMAHLAVDQNDQALLAFLVEKQGTVDPPLRLACEFLQNASIAAVPSNGFDPALRLNLNLQEEKTGLTPLHYAVKRSEPNQALVEFMLLKGANPDISDSSVNLVSPFQLASTNEKLAPVFQKYSGSQIRYDARLNSFINDEIEAKPEARKTILDLAKSYKDIVMKEGFQDVQNINRVIALCQTNERLNLMGYSLKYLLPAISTKVAQTAKTRNDSLQSWIKDYGAKICVAENMSVQDAVTGNFRELTLKDLFKETLITHTNAATAPVKTLNRNLWCSIVKPKAIEDGCWDSAVDELLVAGLPCPS